MDERKVRKLIKDMNIDREGAIELQKHFNLIVSPEGHEEQRERIRELLAPVPDESAEPDMEEESEEYRKNYATILDEQTTKVRFVGNMINAYEGFGGRDDENAVYYILSDIADVLDRISEDLSEQDVVFPKRPI